MIAYRLGTWIRTHERGMVDMLLIGRSSKGGG
jgi:hypothetical protein